MSYIPVSTESALSACSAIDLGATVQLAITASNDYGASNTSAARVKLYTSINNLTWDSDAYATFDNNLSVGSTIRTTVPVCPDPRYMKIRVENLDGTYNISNVVISITQKYIE